MTEFPNDEDGMVLRELAKSGLEMTKQIVIEFFVDSPNENASNEIDLAMKKSGYNTEIYFDQGELIEGEKMTEENKDFWPSCTVYAFVKMKPTYNEIIRIQKELDSLSIPHGGKSDGWQVQVN